ncbi:hypothetical protein ABPG73_004480 [Tetrahymena malaccensis]
MYAQLKTEKAAQKLENLRTQLQLLEKVYVLDQMKFLHHQVLKGRTSMNECIKENEYFSSDTILSCKPQYCIHQISYKVSCVKLNDSLYPGFNGVDQNGNCVALQQYVPNLYKCAPQNCKKTLNNQNACFNFNGQKGAAGIDSNGMCLDFGQATAIRFCINSNNVCQQYDSTYVGKNNLHQCLKPLEKISIECTSDYCIDLVQNYCVQINDTNPSQSGVQNNFKCAVSGQYYPSLKQQCSQNYCIQIQHQPIYMEGCFLFDDALQRVGIDQDGYCLQKDQPNAVRCMKGQYCLNYLNENQCQQLQLSYDSNRFARQNNTQYCLPYIDPNKAGDEIETCVSGTCLHTDSNLGQYCLIQGYIYNGDLIVGTDINQGCIIQDQVTTTKIESCYGLTYCVLDIGGGQYKCQQLQESDPIYPDLIYKAKNTDQTCQDLNQRKLIILGVPGSSVCVDGYCLFDSACQSLSPEYPGIEKNTYNCLAQSFEGQYGASSCYQIELNERYPALFEIRDVCSCKFETPKQKDLRFFQKKVMCDQRKYCIDPIKLSCILIDLTKGMCIDKNGFCTQNGKCDNCDITQCLSSISSNVCQDLVQPSKYQCKDINGLCQNLESPNCYICPSGYCLIDNICKGSAELLKLVEDKSCFSYEPKSNSCIQSSLNVPNQNGNMNCMNNQSFCQDISINNSNCIQCPIYYFNPGNQKCYNLEQKLQLSPIPQQLSFDMNLTYIKQDCYDNYNCLLDPQLKCPKGCYSCNSPTFCTQCIEGYFLYQQGSNQQVCIQCAQMIQQDISLKPYYNQIPTYQCLDCSSEYGIWQNLKYSKVFVQFKNIKQALKDVSLVYKVQIKQQCVFNVKIHMCFKMVYVRNALIIAQAVKNYSSVLNFNQAQLISYSVYQIAQQNFIKKCIACQNGYQVSSDGQSCIKNIKNCEHSTMQMAIGAYQYDLDEYIWSYIQSIQNTITTTQICKNCVEGYILSNDKTRCSYGCLSQTKDKKCSSCFTQSNPSTNPSPPANTYSVQCFFCKEGYILNQASKIYRCQEDLCKNFVQGCQKCFKYQDPSSSNQSDQIYQCIECIDQYSIPSLLSCKKCPIGCSQCYEGTRNYNFTSKLVYERTQFTIQDKLNYNLNNYQLYCTQCLDGYYFNQQTKSCIQIKCGTNCLKCILINNQPQCMQCNYDKLLAQLNELSYFIGIFYFKQNFIPDPQSMITLTSSGDDCQICPILCETCINDSDTSLNPLFIYDAQCLSCKQTLDSSYTLQNYVITYDKSRKKCYLCQNSEQGCYYKKQKVIYAQCLDLSSRIGDGSKDEPLNFSRLSEVNLNEFIINEIDYNQAVIYYNELQVKDLEVQLIFVDNTCNDYKPQVFGITIKENFRTLTTSLNITTLNSSFVLQFMQLGVFTISGFDKVYIENISFQQQISNVNLGLVILNNLFQDVELLNCQFQQQEQTSKQFMILSFSKYKQATVKLQQVVFQNIVINNAQSLISIISAQESSQIYIEIYSSKLINVNFQESTLLSLNSMNSTVLIYDLLITESSFDQKSIMIDLQQNYQSNQNITINIQNINFEKSNFLHRSQIINSININEFLVSNITFQNCVLLQTQKEYIPLIISNNFNITQLNIISNNITNYSFIQQLDSQLNQGNQTSSLTEVQILDNQATYSVFFLVMIQTQLSGSCLIDRINIQRNLFQQDVTQILIYFSGLQQVIIQNIATIDNQYFLLLQTESIERIKLSEISQKQTDKQFIAPSICYLRQSTKEITILNLQQESINISSNIFFFENNFNTQQQNTLQITIKNILSIQTKVVVLDSTQDISLFSINSKFSTNFKIQNVTFTSFSVQFLINKPVISKISYGFYFQSATTNVNITNSAFNNLELSSPFNWMQGLVKQISLISCNFTNLNNYLNITQVRKGGFFQLSTEQLDIKYSQFILGQAQIGGAFYLNIQNYGKLDIFKSTFQNNIAYSNDDLDTQGGAIYIDATYSRTFDIFVIQSNFSNNFALNGGGALKIKSLCQKGAVIIQKSTFYDNFSCQGSSINIQNYLDSQAKIILSYVKINNQIQNTINTIQQLTEIFTKQRYQIIQSSEPSQVYIEQASNTQIIFSRFQIVPSQNIKNQQFQFKQIIFQKFLIINNVQNYFELNNIYEKSVFYENLILVKNIQNIYIYDNQISNNQNINNWLQGEDQNVQNLAFYSSQNCLIKNLTVTNNVCYECNFGILQISTSNLLLQDSIFINNIAQYGPGLFVQQAQQPINSALELQNNLKNQLIISKSKFTNNKAIVSGGAVYIKESSIFISQSIFDKNIARQYGGAIFLQTDKQDVLKNLIELNNSTFTNNQASYGGALGSTTGQRVNKYFSCIFKDNMATFYGQNIQTAPTQFNISINNEFISSQKLIINNHLGGSFQDQILIRLSNEQNENILNIPSDSFLLVKILGDDGYLSQNKITHKNGIFNLTQQIQIYGYFGQSLQLQITSDLIQIPQFSQKDYIINYVSQSVIFNVQNIQQCQVGQIFKTYKNKFDYCQDCKDSQYSFTVSNTCQSCPSQEAKCYKNYILLPANLWRVSQTSAVLYPCKNCVGDLNLRKRLKNRNLLVIKRTDQNYYCKQGYVGALCEDCDRSGQSWGDKYYMNLHQQCQKCSDITFTEIIYPAIILIITIAIPLYIESNLQKQLKIKLITKITQILFKKFYGNRFSNNVRIIKFFIFQLSIIGVTFSYDNYIPSFIVRLFIDAGNLFPAQLRVAECFLQDIFKESRIIYKSIYLSLGIYFLVAIYLVIHNTLIITKFKYKGQFQSILTSISLLLYFSLITILSKIFRSVNCQKFDNLGFVMEYLSLNCNLVFQTYYDSLVLIVITLVLLFPIVFIIFKLFRARYFFKMYKNERLYGFFILDYKQQFYLWDFVKLCYKLILFLIFQYSYLMSQLQVVISILISLSYSLLVLRYKPYESEKLNQIDFKISYLTAICFSINTMQFRMDQKLLELLCTSALVCVVTIIFYLICFQLSCYQIPKYIQIIKYMQSNSPKCQQIIQKLGLDKHVLKYQRAQMMWQKIRQRLPELKQFFYLRTNIYQKNQIQILNKLYSSNKIQNKNIKIITTSQIVHTQ